jgi:hypothetical protein
MAYNPPGVIVTQVQKTNSPTLIEPDLSPAVVGPAYKVVSIASGYTSPYAAYNGSQTVITVDGLDSTMKLDPNSVYVDLVMPPSAATASIPADSRYIFATSGVTVGSTTVTVPAIVGWSGAKVMIGYRALRSDLNSSYKYTALSELLSEHGDLSVANPLGFAAKQAMANGQASVWTYGTVVDSFNNLSVSGTEATSHDLALEDFGMQEVYSLTPLSVTDSIISAYKTHANSFSDPEAKKERVVIAAPKIGWYDSGNPATQRSTTALSVSTKSGSMGEKRVFYVFPDVAFVQESRHITTLNPTYISAAYSLGFSTAVNARLVQTVTFASTNTETAWAGKTVNPTAGVGEEIDASLYRALLSHANSTKNPFYTAFVPVPASVALTSAVAGQIAGNPPQQGLTNMPIAGVDAVKFSSDWFSETNLNTIAAGGTYILRQQKPGASISARHQLSTDMSSVEKRELSITKTVDYVSKFVRTTVSPFIGKYIINDLSLTLIRATIIGVLEFLKRQGVINGYTLDSLTQDTVNKDTVLSDITIQPPYPVNKISVRLIF